MGQIGPQNMGVSNIHGEGVQAVACPFLNEEKWEYSEI